MILSRRRVLLGLLAAPIVVRSGVLMPVKQWRPKMLRFVCVGVGVSAFDEDNVGNFEPHESAKFYAGEWRHRLAYGPDESLWWRGQTSYKIGDIVEMRNEAVG